MSGHGSDRGSDRGDDLVAVPSDDRGPFPGPRALALAVFHAPPPLVQYISDAAFLPLLPAI